LGPDPPPGENIKFIDFYPFFMILGPSIEPEKPSPKSASTANPPQKHHFIAIFINSLLNFVPYTFLFDHYPLQNWLLFIFWSLVLFTLGEKPNSFSFIVGRMYVVWGIVPLDYKSNTTNIKRKTQSAPKKGHLRRNRRQ
jgi:hypothetical protein